MRRQQESAVPEIIDSIVQGDCMEVMAGMPPACVDMVFADPPYNLQLKQPLYRPNMSKVDAVDDDWDQFESFAAYDTFTRAWLAAVRRVLKPTGTLWVIGTYHNIHRVGVAVQDLGFWLLNDVTWVKSNPMPNFAGVRMCNAQETLIWAAMGEKSGYTFNHHTAKRYGEGKQLRSDWRLPLCTGAERLADEDGKLHSTQKPEALVERTIAICTRPGDLVLDPFAGSGTTPTVARRMGRRYIGIEREEQYLGAARARVDAAAPDPVAGEVDKRDLDRRRRRVSFREVVETGMLRPGAKLSFGADGRREAVVAENGMLDLDGAILSIHGAGAAITGAPCNGWDHWRYRDRFGNVRRLSDLRDEYESRQAAEEATKSPEAI
ncbi:MAG: DNA methyltransferase [Armatimonadetes bacterium]|nr:DNA methyltransferase [Armatimonadota bacterium]